jgi:putative tricarboxylic transport membrane protein
MKQALSRAHLYVGGLLVLFGVSIAIYSFSWPYYTKLGPGPGFFPFWTAVLLTVLGLMIAVTNIISLKRARASMQYIDREPLFKSSEIKRISIIIFALCMSSALLTSLGFTISLSLLSIFLLQIIGKWGWIKSIVLSVIFTAGLFWAFKLWLNVPLPIGWFGL